MGILLLKNNDCFLKFVVFSKLGIAQRFYATTFHCVGVTQFLRVVNIKPDNKAVKLVRGNIRC